VEKAMVCVWNERTRGWALVLLRMVMGAGFLVHGWAKWSRGPANFGRLLAQVGVPWPVGTAYLVTGLEVFGGLALVAGALVMFVSVPLMVSMVVAMVTVQGRYGFSSVNTIGLTPEGPLFGPPGYEINLLYIAGLAAVMLAGPDRLSVDGWWARRRAGAAGGTGKCAGRRRGSGSCGSEEFRGETIR
jgi:putative oxidoreductase